MSTVVNLAVSNTIFNAMKLRLSPFKKIMFDHFRRFCNYSKTIFLPRFAPAPTKLWTMGPERQKISFKKNIFFIKKLNFN